MKMNLSNPLIIVIKSVFLLEFLIIGCTGKKETINHNYQSRPEVRAKSRIEQSLHVTSDNKVASTGLAASGDGSAPTKSEMNILGSKIGINKSALDKEFLLQSSIIMQPRVALGSGLKSRIVRFVERHDDIVLLDSVDGNSITKDIPQNLVLAVFPITSRATVDKEEVITFDFNKGMSDLFVAGDWRASDFEGIGYNQATEFRTASVRQSYIEEAKFLDNHLTLRQVAKLEVVLDEKGTKSYLPTEIKYYLSPYRANETFRPVALSQNFDRMGFFEVAPYQDQNSVEQIRISKFNETKPIVFAISANTPELFKQAVKDGILYWNKAYGKELIQVIDAPKGVYAPDLNYNVVQWINWDDAGFAYADAQMDPRTGEILHAQVYFTSAFAVHGKAHARKLLKNINNMNKKKQKYYQVGIQGLTSTPMCNLSMTNAFAASLSNLVNSGADDTKILKAAQDYVREVSAHEIGHTLGLRHNFAGSLAMNYSMQDRPKIIKNYFENGKTDDGIIPSSSVMEYQVFEEGAMSGDLIAKSKSTLTYDEKAIKTLYYGEKFSAEEIPLFCTDSHVMKGDLADCTAFDVGSSVADSKRWESDKVGKGLLEDLISSYVFAKAPPKGVEPRSIQAGVYLPPVKDTAVGLLFSQFDSLKLLTGKYHLLKIQRQFQVFDGEDQEVIANAELDYILSEINARGGIKSYVLDIESGVTDAWISLLDNYLEKNKKGIGFAEQPYEFSDDEVAFIKKKLTSYLKQVGVELQKSNIAMLSGTPIFTTLDPTLTEGLTFLKSEKLPELPSYMANMARKYILTPGESGKVQFVDIEVDSDQKKEDGTAIKKKIVVGLPEFKYPYDIRVAAVGMLKYKTPDNPFWFTLEKRKVAKQFEEFMTKIFTIPLATVDPITMPNTAAQWVFQNQAISASMQME